MQRNTPTDTDKTTYKETYSYTHIPTHTPVHKTNLYIHTYLQRHTNTHTQYTKNLKQKKIQLTGIKKKQPGYDGNLTEETGKLGAECSFRATCFKGNEMDFIPPLYLFLQLTWKTGLRLAKHKDNTKSRLHSLKNASARGPGKPILFDCYF